MTRAYSTLCVYTSDWIYLTTNIYPDLKYFNGKVSFHFPLTETIINSISDFNTGKKIEANKFTITIKSLKSQIFQMKECKGNEW